MSKDTSAPAASAGVAETKLTEGVTLKRHPLTSGTPGHPFALFKGKAPKVGQTLSFTLENGVTYSGVVSEATEADGEVLAEFRDGVKPLPKS